MKVVIRADASVEIGTGHVMRCLTLAEELKNRGAVVEFACVPLTGNLIELIRTEGYACHVLSDLEALVPAKGDWLVVDHYGIDAAWETRMRKQFSRIFVIDDLANRRHDCDILLDQNIYEQEPPYRNLIPEDAMQLLGPHYVLLRKEFAVLRSEVGIREKVENILVFFGGSDPTNETRKALAALDEVMKRSGRLLKVDVVVGSSNPFKENIKLYCDSLMFTFHCQINYMAELMARADLAIGGGGTVTWERYALGLPSICWSIADNQKNNLEVGCNLGALQYLGEKEKVTHEICAVALEKVIHDQEALSHSSVQAMNLVDARGVKRVVDTIISCHG